MSTITLNLERKRHQSRSETHRNLTLAEQMGPFPGSGVHIKGVPRRTKEDVFKDLTAELLVRGRHHV